MKFGILFIVFFCCIVISCSSKQEQEQWLWRNQQDSVRFQSLAAFQQKSITQLGRQFLETPYIARTLEVGDDYTVVINLRALDCTTFVETVLALKMQKNHSLKAFEENLEKIRYRGAKANGYATRLHYFIDWIRTNEARGIVKDITSELGGKLMYKTVDFMTQHRKFYPRLEDPECFSTVQKIEQELTRRPYFEIPKEKVPQIVSKIKEGDIVVITSVKKGLVVAHLGFATRTLDKTLHLLHASSDYKKVVISPKPLVDYLKSNRLQQGIIVLRFIDF